MNPVRLFAVASLVCLLSHVAVAGDNTTPPVAPAAPAPLAPDMPGLVHEGVLLTGPYEGQTAQTAIKVAPGQADNVFFYLNAKKVKATYLGVYISATDATLQSQLGLPEGVGLVVSGMDDTGPAQKAGLHAHDVIYKIGDQIAINPAQFEVLVRLHKPGETVELTVYRQAQQIKVSATLAEKELPALASSPQGNNLYGQGTVTFPNMNAFTPGDHPSFLINPPNRP